MWTNNICVATLRIKIKVIESVVVSSECHSIFSLSFLLLLLHVQPFDRYIHSWNAPLAQNTSHKTNNLWLTWKENMYMETVNHEFNHSAVDMVGNMKLLECFSHAFAYNATIIVDKPLTAHPLCLCNFSVSVCVVYNVYVCCLYPEVVNT